MLLCVICDLDPASDLEPAEATVAGLSLCHRHARAVADNVIDGYALRDILESARDGGY